jgi:two-component system cell cycle sensor histidine kinase/response regulator CckA
LGEETAGEPKMKATVLVVDDEASMRRLAERTLRAAGYEVLTAPGGRDALRRLEGGGGEIDLLLSDVMMPEMPGPVLAERAASLQPELRILFMSGLVGRHSSEAPAGPELLEKPFRAEELLAKVRAVLEADPPAKG